MTHKWKIEKSRLNLPSLQSHLPLSSRRQRHQEVSLERGSVGAGAVGAAALGTLAIGAVAIGAIAIGALAIKHLAIKRARIERLSVGTLEVDRLVIHKRGLPDDAGEAPEQGAAEDESKLAAAL